MNGMRGIERSDSNPPAWTLGQLIAGNATCRFFPTSTSPDRSAIIGQVPSTEQTELRHSGTKLCQR